MKAMFRPGNGWMIRCFLMTGMTWIISVTTCKLDRNDIPWRGIMDTARFIVHGLSVNPQMLCLHDSSDLRLKGCVQKLDREAWELIEEVSVYITVVFSIYLIIELLEATGVFDKFKNK